MTSPTDQDLRAFGYATGNYTVRCHTCNMTAVGLDKRCITCRLCAIKRWREWYKILPQPEPKAPSPWVPMTDTLDIAHLGKLAEELAEAGAAISRCLIQGIDQTEPTTGKPNKQWLQEEIADVLANIELVTKRFDLNIEGIDGRFDSKIQYLQKWHKMLATNPDPIPLIDWDRWGRI